MKIYSLFLLVSILACGQNKKEIKTDSKIVATNLSLTDVSLKKVVKTEAYWKKELTNNQFSILRKQDTEPAFNNEYHDNKVKGNYFCAGCKLPLFSSETKFNSGTGWPSFYAPIKKDRVKQVTDVAYGMSRTEIVCARCEGHLGHVFDDGPEPTGLRYCMNSGAMLFLKTK